MGSAVAPSALGGGWVGRGGKAFRLRGGTDEADAVMGGEGPGPPVAQGLRHVGGALVLVARGAPGGGLAREESRFDET